MEQKQKRLALSLAVGEIEYSSFPNCIECNILRSRYEHCYRLYDVVSVYDDYDMVNGVITYYGYKGDYEIISAHVWKTRMGNEMSHLYLRHVLPVR